MQIKAAIIDLYNNEKNEGMRCIQDLLKEANNRYDDISLTYDIYETRYKEEIPNVDYDIYFSSGGPGDPFDGEGKVWEKKYFRLLDEIYKHNQNLNERKKYIFFICHSFQIMARYFKFGTVTKRESRSFGVVPIFKTEDGKKDNIFDKLENPFYGADFRNWQVIQPNDKIFTSIGAKLLAIEDIHQQNPNLERAMMAVRISNEIIGTQFHPEADPKSMLYHFNQPEKQKEVIEEYGEEKLNLMLKRLENPDNIPLTRNTVIPNFLNGAINNLKNSSVLV